MIILRGERRALHEGYRNTECYDANEKSRRTVPLFFHFFDKVVVIV
jgi:hypothetical protein